MSLTFLSTPFSLISSIAVVLFTAALAWMGWRRSDYAIRVGLLELLRTLIVAMVAITYNQPEWLSQYVPDDQPTLLVLKDVSGSMDTADVLDGAAAAQAPITRRDWVAT